MEHIKDAIEYLIKASEGVVQDYKIRGYRADDLNKKLWEGGKNGQEKN